MTKLGNRLKELRIKNNLTQQQMVEVLGLKHKSHYSQIENGEIRVSLELALKVSKYFHKSIEEIFFEN